MEQTCIKCNKKKDANLFRPRMKTCKFCKWLEKHDLQIPDQYNKDEVLLMLELIHDGKIEYLNELENYTHFTITEIIVILRDELKLSNIGNKKLRVKVHCENCGKEIITFMCKMKINNFNFCSHQCYSEFRSKYYIGEKSSVYKSSEVECDYCHTPFLLPQNKLDITNKEGKSHHFCSHECYSKFRSIYYVGDKLYNTGIKMSDEFRENCRINTVKCYSEGKINRCTIPQKIVNEMLNEMNIKYQNEYSYKYYSVDNYLCDYDLIIEVMGDYFHANPFKYRYDDLNDMQKKDVARDKRKRTYIFKYYGINILYLWESDIKNNPNKCKELIKHYMNNHGVLSDYHSFNYDDSINLNKNIISPYFIEKPVTNKLLCGDV